MAAAIVAVFGFATSAAAQPPGPEILEPGAAYQAAHSAAAAALVARVRTLVRDDDTRGLAQLVDDALADPTLDPAARERVLYETALAIADLDIAADPNALLAALAAHEPAVQVWRYDDGHRLAGPLYDVASAARFAGRRLDERRASAAALPAIARGSDAPLAALDAMADAPAAARRGILQAFETAPPEQLLTYRDRLSLALERGADIEVAQIVARRLGDASLMQSVLEHADAPQALDIVRTARASFTDEEAFDLLKAAAARDDVGSAALLEMGPIMSGDPRARAYLLDMLRDPRLAGSAAAALAARHDPDLAAALRAWVQGQSTVAVARRGILALRLDASASARAELARLAVDPALSAELRAEALR